MSISDLFVVVKEFAKEYYPLVALASTFLGLFVGSRFGLWQRAWAKIRDICRTDIRQLKKENAELDQRLLRVRDAFDDDNNLWLRQPIVRPVGYDSR